jgi:hypothetical protein
VERSLNSPMGTFSIQSGRYGQGVQIQFRDCVQRVVGLLDSFYIDIDKIDAGEEISFKSSLRSSVVASINGGHGLPSMAVEALNRFELLYEY